jgi:hypothetical protein
LKPSVPKGKMRVVEKRRVDGKKGNFCSLLYCFFFNSEFKYMILI